MVATTSINDVKKALSSLTAATSSQKNSSIRQSMSQLTSALTLLELSSPTCSTIDKLVKMLRQPMLPLYQHHSSPAYTFCSTVLDFIFTKKLPAHKSDTGLTKSWEGVLHALLSGVLDFLEENPKDAVKTAIGNLLYPILAKQCFHRSKTDTHGLSANLICVAYVLLTETAMGHTDNRRKLRNATVLGGKRIGLTLSLCREYLVIEALLELMAGILPPSETKGSKLDKRRSFVESTFDPKFFSCSSDLRDILLFPNTTDWDVLSLKLSDTLSASSIDFPQPFTIHSLKVGDLTPNVGSRIYLDKNGFTSNIDEDGTFETFHVAAATVVSVQVLPASGPESVVALQLTAFPVIGKTPPSEQKPTKMTFKLTDIDVKRFLSSVSARDMSKCITRPTRKMSKLNVDLPLDFDSVGVPYHEKAELVLSLSPTCGRMPPTPTKSTPTNLMLTSPLTPIADKYKPRMVVCPQLSTPAKPLNSSGIPPRVHFATSPPLNSKASEATNEVTISHPVVGRKRPRTPEDEVGQDVEKAKRKKVEPTIFGTAARPNKRYGRKGRSSSPLPTSNPASKDVCDDISSDSEPPKLPGRLPNVSVKHKKAKPQVPAKKARMSAAPKAKLAVKEDKMVDTVRRSARVKNTHEPPPPNTDTSPSPEPLRLRHGEKKVVPPVESSPPSAPAPAVLDADDDDFKLPPKPAKSSRPVPRPVTKKAPTKPQVTSAPKVIPKGPPRAKKESLAEKQKPVRDRKPSIPNAQISDEPILSHMPESEHTEEDATMAPGSLAAKEETHTQKLDAVPARLPLQAVKPTIDLTQDTPPKLSTLNRKLQKPEVIAQHQDTVHKKKPIRPADSLPTTAPTKLPASKLEKLPQPALTQKIYTMPDNAPHVDLFEPLEIVLSPRASQDIPRPVVLKKLPPENAADTQNRDEYRTQRSPSIMEIDSMPRPEPMKTEPKYYTDRRPSDLHAPPMKPATRTTAPRSQYAVKQDYGSHRHSTPEKTGYAKDGMSKRDHRNRRDENEVANTDASIIEVLNEIQGVLVNRISRKFKYVRSDVRAGRMSILQDAAISLESMRLESVGHFNALIDLESEYASYRRRLVDGYGAMAVVNSEISERLGEILQAHDRRMLSKSFEDVLARPPSVLLARGLAA